MLEGLETIDWSSLTHAYGTATDVPELLRSLLSEDADRWMEACAVLCERIWHQAVFSASAAAIPFLFELATQLAVEDSGCAISRSGCAVSLLCAIATGEGLLHYGLRVDGEQRVRARLARDGRSLDEALREERATMEAIRRGVSAGLRHLLPYLGHPAPDLRAHVAAALGDFPEHGSWLLPTIAAALASESDENVLQVLAESKERLTKG